MSSSRWPNWENNIMRDADSSSVGSYPVGEPAAGGDDPASYYDQTQVGTTDTAVGQPAYTMYSSSTYPATYSIATSQPDYTTYQSGSGYQYQGQASTYPASSYQYATGNVTTNTDTYLQQAPQDIQGYYSHSQTADTSAADWAGYAAGDDADPYWQEDSQLNQGSSPQLQTADNTATDYQTGAAGSSTREKKDKHRGKKPKKKTLVTESLGEMGNPVYDEKSERWVNKRKCDQCLRDGKECYMDWEEGEKRRANCYWCRTRTPGEARICTFDLNVIEPSR